MKILINIPTLGDSGIGIPLLYKIKSFQELGCDIYINNGFNIEKIKKITDVYKFNQSFSKNHSYLKFKNNTKFSYILFCIKRNITSMLNIKSILNNFNIIYSPSSVLDLTLFPFIIKIIKPKIIWCSVFDNIVPINDQGNKIYRFLAWIFYQISVLFLKKADLIIFTSKILFDYPIIKKFNSKKIIFVSCGIEDNLIKHSRPNKKKYDALFIGRINETKGIYDMLDVMLKIKPKFPNFTLAIMGKGDSATESRFKKKINELKLEKQIKFLGFVSGIKRFNITKSSKIFLFLSKSESETFGISLLESVCCGLPAITYKLKPYKYIYQKKEIYSFKIGDTKAVANQIINIFNNKKFTNTEGKKLIKKYSWENNGKLEYLALKKVMKNNFNNKSRN